MSLTECGCPGLVTPTLDDLLAVARNKPLPRVTVRDRRPPPAKLGASLKGWMEWRLVNRRGREIAGGEGPNLILDQGLDLIATTQLILVTGASQGTFPILDYAAVGTDSSSPNTSQTGLGAELARTSVTYAADAIARPSNGVYQLTRHFEFDYDEANGNLTEWAVSPSSSASSNTFNRALFTDSGGDPDTVTKTDQEKLRIAYTLEVALSPVELTAGSFTLTGVGTVNGDFTLVGWDQPTSVSNLRRPDLVVFTCLARGDINTVIGVGGLVQRGAAKTWDTDFSSVVYTDDIQGGTDVNNRAVARIVNPRDGYVTSSFERTGGSWRWDTGFGNLNPIKAFSIHGQGDGANSARGGYVFDLDVGSEFSKDNEHALEIGIPTVSWGRASP